MKVYIYLRIKILSYPYIQEKSNKVEFNIKKVVGNMNFSIIITYKNTKGNEKYIDRCLESINEQTYNDYEIILVHNYSEYISKIVSQSELNIKTIEMNEQDNISMYKNSGIENATGEFLVFLDADDFLHPNALIYAKQMIEEKGLERDVFKFGISKTNLDKTSTLSTNKRVFFDDESLVKLEEILNDIDIEVSDNQIKSLINGMFNKNII